MSYVRAYMDTKAMMDRIRSGQATAESADKVQAIGEESRQGLVRKREEAQVEETPQSDPSDIRNTLMKYMLQVSYNPENTAPEMRSEGSVVREPKQPLSGPVEAAREALAAIESRGSGDYSAKGPVMEKGAYKGDRAYGRYQVMGRNIGAWTKEILGVEMTPEEFLADEKAQDRVVEARLISNAKKYGSWEDAASVWFTGKPASSNNNASDGFTNASTYVNKFRDHFNKFVAAPGDEGSKQAPRVSPRPAGAVPRRTK